jgi:hypothetical protein
LIADYKRKEIERQFNCLVPNLTVEQYKLLTKLHKEFLNIDEKITKLLPNNLIHKSVLNPYSMYESIVIKEDDFNSSLFTDEILDKLKNAFRKHKGFQEIGKIPVGIYSELNKISSEKVENIICFFTDRLYKAGATHFPDDMLDALRNAKRDNTLVPLKYFISLMCIRESIRVLNQLIYQSFLQDKLPVYNEDNLIKIESASHFGGKGFSLIAQHTYNVKPKDLVLIIDPYEEKPLPILCQAESVTINFNIEFGNYEDLKLRVIDKDLNPFYGILETMNESYL